MSEFLKDFKDFINKPQTLDQVVADHDKLRDLTISYLTGHLSLEEFKTQSSNLKGIEINLTKLAPYFPQV